MKSILKTIFIAGIILLSGAADAAFQAPEHITADGDTLYISLTRAKEIAVYHPKTRRISKTIPLPDVPNDILFSDRSLIAAVGSTRGEILFLQPSDGKIIKRLKAGHTPQALTLSDDGKTLFWLDRFSGYLNRYELETDKHITITTAREPFAIALHRGNLFIAHLLPSGRSDTDFIGAVIGVYDAATLSEQRTIPLPNGAQSLRALTVTPEGSHIIVTHILSRYQIPATQIDRGWINANAISFINTHTLNCDTTLLLDDVDEGFACPWGITFTNDSTLCIVSNGCHELSIIDYPALKSRLTQSTEDRLSLLNGIRRRIPLGVNGARTVLFSDGSLWCAGRFTDDLVAIDPISGTLTHHALGGAGATTPQALGERYFNDAAYCFQGWQSCISCHPDARADGLNWDLRNDGIGNPKNTRSMLLAHRLPPAMWLGVRKDAQAAVRAGFRHIQFAEPPDTVMNAVDSYLISLSPLPGPALDFNHPERIKQSQSPRCIGCHDTKLGRGSLTASARRGKQLFKGKAKCATCHPHPYFTNGKLVDVGLTAGVDNGRAVKVPSLIECWRTAPYLHDGRAETLWEAITIWNTNGKRGDSRNLTSTEIDDLVEYLRSL